MALIRLPNGKTFPILEGETPQDAWNAALEKYPEAFGFAPTKPKQDTSGFLAAAKGTIEETKGQASLLAGKLGLKSTEEAMRDYDAAKARSREIFTPTQDDWSTSPWLKFKETLGGSLPLMAAPLVVGGAAASLPVSAPVAAGLGFLGATAASTGQFTLSNLGRQVEKTGDLEQADLGTAFGAAIPQALLDTAAMYVMPGIGKLLGRAGAQVTEETAQALARQTVKQVAADYVKATGKVMPVEMLTEATQQAIERYQAGLSIEDPEARQEYLQSIQGAAALTAVLGPFGRAFERGGIKAEGRRLEQARLGEERAAAEAESVRLAAEEAQRRQTPEYLDDLISRYEAAKQGVIDAPKPEKLKKDATPEEEAAYEDALNKHKTAVETLQPINAEYKASLPLITERRQDISRQGIQGPLAQMSIPGLTTDQVEAPRTVPATGTVVPRETIQEQTLRERQNALATAMSDLTSARAAGDTNAVQEAAARIQQLRSQLTEAAPAPTVSPVEQEKQSIFQRLQLQQQIEDLSVRAKQAKDAAMAPGVTPQATADAFKQVQSINQSIVGLKGEINRLGGRVSTLDELKTKRDSLLTKFENAKKAKAEPQVAKLLADIQKVDEKIALYEKPVDERQAGFDLRPAEPAPAPVATPAPAAKPELKPGEQAQIEGVERVAPAPAPAPDAVEEAPQSAFDIQEEIRKLEMLAQRQEESAFKETEPEAYQAAVKKAEATRASIPDAQNRLAEAQARESAQEAAAFEKEGIPAFAAQADIADLKNRLASAQNRFQTAKQEKDSAKAKRAASDIVRLRNQLAVAQRAQPQVNLEQGATALQTREKELAEKMAAAREQSAEKRRKAEESRAKAAADAKALAEKAKTPEAAKPARVERKKEVERQKREVETFEAEGPGAAIAAKQAAETKRREEERKEKTSARKRPEIARMEEEGPGRTALEQDRQKKAATARKEKQQEDEAIARFEGESPSVREKTDAVAKAETDAKTAMDENPETFEDKNFESDTDTDADSQMRANNAIFDARPTTPLSKAAIEAAEDGNLMGLIDELAKSKIALHRDIAEAVKKMQAIIPRRTKVSVQDDVMARGTSVEGVFQMRRNRILLGRKHLSEEVALHELVHSVTSAVFRAPIDSLPLIQREARMRLETIFSKIQNNPVFATEYGSVSAEEFAAEIMTNRNLRNKLDSFDKTLWQRIVRGLMELIGLNPDRMSAEAIQATFAMFEPPQKATIKDNDAVVMASVMRGVFPGRGVVASDRVNEGVVNTLNNLVGRTQSIGDRIMANATGLRLRTKLADNWAPTEALLKRGVEKGKVSEAQALQLRFLMRVTNDVNRQVSLAFTQGVPQLVTREGVKVLEGQTGVTPQQIAKVLSRSKLGNDAFVENMFTSWLAILRAEKEGIGYDRLNYGNDKDGNPVLDANKAAGIKAAVDSDPDTKAAFNEARDLYRQYNKDLLNLYVEAGAMSREKANELLQGDYVPYYRIRNGAVELMLGSRKVTIGNIVDQPQLKELVGGDEKILPLYSSMMQNTSLLLRGAVTNMQTRDVANMVQDMGLGKIIKGEGPRNVYVARFKQKGVDYYLRLDPSAFPDDIPADVFVMGLQGIKTAIPTAVRAMQMPVGLLRKGITRMPVYAFRQLIRDPIHAYLTTGGDFSAVLDTYREFIKSLKAPTQAGEALERAGAVSSMVQTGGIEDQARILRSITSGKYSLARGMAMLDTFAHKADTATRAAVYNNYRKKGFSHLESVLAAAESMNFARRGTSASLHWMGAMIPFFNAQIQGLDAVYRAAFTKDVPFQDRMQITQKLYKRGALIAGMAVAYALMMQDDEAYKNATPQERAMNYFIYLPGSDEPIRVPIPFELGFVFKALPELAINTAFGDTKARDALGVILKQLEASVPIGIPSAVKPLVELSANHNFFTDVPIESAREVNLRPQDRFRANTTELAKLLGATTGASPLQIEHLVRGYTGTLGMALMAASNLALRPLTTPEDVSPQDRKLSEMPFIGSLFQPETGRGVLDAVYKDIKEYEQAAQSYKELVKAGRVAEAAEFASKYSAQIALNSTGGSFRQKMGEFAEFKRVIAAMPKMSGEEKQRQIEAVKRLEIQLARNIRDIAKNLE